MTPSRKLKTSWHITHRSHLPMGASTSMYRLPVGIHIAHKPYIGYKWLTHPQHNTPKIEGWVPPWGYAIMTVKIPVSAIIVVPHETPWDMRVSNVMVQSITSGSGRMRCMSGRSPVYNQQYEEGKEYTSDVSSDVDTVHALGIHCYPTWFRALLEVPIRPRDRFVAASQRLLFTARMRIANYGKA